MIDRIVSGGQTGADPRCADEARAPAGLLTAMVIRCTGCRAGHPMGEFAPGDRVVTRSKHADLHAGTRGFVVAYVITAGAQHQEVHVRLRSKSKRVVVLAPCDLARDPAAAPTAKPQATYETLSREQFRDRLRAAEDRRAVVRMLVLAPPA